MLAACGSCSGEPRGSNSSADQGSPGESQVAGQAGGPPNIVLISIDTLRADRLGAYGYERPTSPHLDAVAKRGAVFENAFTPCSWTLPSHISLFTGLYPRSHGVRKHGQKLSKDVTTLGEVLEPAGYRSFAITGGGYLARRYGYPRGFDKWEHDKSPFVRLVRKARKILSPDVRDGDPFFLFLHTYDVHCPYAPPKRFRKKLLAHPEYKKAPANECSRGLNGLDEAERREHAQYLSELYDGEVRRVDEALSELFAFFDEHGMWEDTYFIFLSDHGEQFYEHGKLEHGRHLYMELLRVPFIVVGPGVEPQRIDEKVNLIDFLATITELTGADGPDTQGRSLMPLLRGRDVDWDERPHFAETGKRRSVLTGRRHYIHNPNPKIDGVQERELYDWIEDPYEQNDLYDDEPEQAARHEELVERYARELYASSAESAGELTDEEKERLRALGYIE